MIYPIKQLSIWILIPFSFLVIKCSNFKCIKMHFHQVSIAQRNLYISPTSSLLYSNSSRWVANLYSLWFSQLQKLMILISACSFSVPSIQLPLASIFHFILFLTRSTKNWFSIFNKFLILSFEQNPLSIIPIPFSGIGIMVWNPYLLSFPCPKCMKIPSTPEVQLFQPPNSFTWWDPYRHSSLLVRVIIVESNGKYILFSFSDILFPSWAIALDNTFWKISRFLVLLALDSCRDI